MSKWGSHSSTAANVDLKAANNGTWMDAFQFGTPGDETWTLTDMVFKLDVQRNRYDEVPLLSLSSADSEIVIADVYQRVIHMNVEPDAFKDILIPGIYVYDLIMIDSDGRRVPLMYGTLEIIQGVTYP